MSKKVTFGVISLSAVVCIGLVMIMIACFSGGISWIPEAFSFMKNLFP